MLTNPALAKVVNLNCDVFSLGKIQRKDGNVDDFIQTIQRPNYFQTLRQFLWSYRFFIMFGNAYVKPNTKLANNDRGQLYLLNSANVDFSQSAIDKLDKMVLSQASLSRIEKTTIQYNYNDGTQQDIPLKDLIVFSDLSNNTGNWYKGASRIDALHKILCNNESLLNAKNINLEFVQKFLVSGNYDPTKSIESFVSMQDVEKENIENRVRSNKPVHALKTQVDIKRFVENLADLELDDTYVNDLLIIADMYGIPKELVGALADGSTYENQDRAISRHITYSEMPKGTDLIEGLANHFDKNADDYEMTWEHLPAMQKDQKTLSEVNERNVRTLKALIELGVPQDEAMELLGFEDLNIDYENRPQETPEAQGAENGESTE